MVSKAEELLNKVQEEKQTRDEKLIERAKADKFFAKVFQAENNTHNRTLIHPETKKVIGRKFKYREDGDGKNIYDYVCYNEDPFEQKMLEKLKIEFDENDPKDGSWVDKRIKIDWKDRTY